MVEATGGGRGWEEKVRLHPTVAPGSVLQRCPKWRPTAGLLIHSEGANFGGQVPSAGGGHQPGVPAVRAEDGGRGR